MKLDATNFSHYLPEYTWKAEFENDFDYFTRRQWLLSNPLPPLITSVLYVAAVFLIKRLMKNRKELDLKTPLAFWSAGLAVFSIIGSIRTLPTLFHVVGNFGLHNAICTEGDIAGVYGFWVWAFLVSKFPELIDTLFILLRKQKLIFLHWFHHVSVLGLVWFSNANNFSIGRWFLVMNYVVHSIMYSYFAMRAFGMRPPKPFAMFVTLAQLAQMFWGSYVTTYALIQINDGKSCDTNLKTIYMSLMLYLAYLLLFAHFFVNNYFGGYAIKGFLVRLKPIIRGIFGKPVLIHNNNLLTGFDGKMD